MRLDGVAYEFKSIWKVKNKVAKPSRLAAYSNGIGQLARQLQR
jgi:hypothetical protein